MLYSRLKSMEININCDLGEKSKFHSIKNDPELLKIVNSANVACGYHAGDQETMEMVVKISKENGVSIGAHPSFDDPDNFGRKRINLNSFEIKKLIIDQYEILQNIALKYNENVTHIKPHGALNNMACEDINLASTLAKTIYEIDKNIIYLVPTGSKMEIAAKKLDMKILWRGKGSKEKGFNLNGKPIIECDKNYFRPLDVNTLLGDARKARKKLRWKPKEDINSLIDEMIKSEYQSLNFE